MPLWPDTDGTHKKTVLPGGKTVLPIGIIYNEGEPSAGWTAESAIRLLPVHLLRTNTRRSGLNSAVVLF